MDNGDLCYKRYINGDDEGLVDIIRDYKDGLILYLYGITGNIGLSEEYAEETFFKLAVKKPVFRGKSSFKTWLYAISRNAAIDGMRKSSRISDTPLEEYTDIYDESDIEADLLKEEQRLHLHRAMKNLSNDYRQVLYLTFFEDFSIDETAKIMKKSKKQINNLLYRAKQSLKAILEKGGFSYEEL